MSVRDLIPWGRSSVPSTLRGGEVHPVLAFHREMNRLFDDFFRGFDAPLSSFGGFAGWPQIDIVETESECRVVVELPGLDEKDIELTLTDNVLTLRGEKRVENDGQGAFYSERFHGRFQRSIQLDADVERDKVAASFKNGVLTVILPKSAEASTRAKRIPINGG